MFVLRKRASTLTRRDQTDADSPLSLQALFLDATTGEIRNAPEWPATSRPAGIVAAFDGKSLTQRGNELVLYASDLQPIKEMRLPGLQGADWTPHTSPTGRSVLFLPSDSRRASWLWVDTERLQVVNSWDDLQTGEVAIDDDKISMVKCLSTNRCEVRVRTVPGDGEWKMLTSSQHAEVPQFVNSDLLFLWSRRSISLMRLDGQLLFRQHAPSEGEALGRAVVAAGGSRFAVPVFTSKGGVPALDIAGHSVLNKILVYDVSSQKQSYTLDARGIQIRGPVHFALSPNGQLLAMLNYESLQVFQLPALQ